MATWTNWAGNESTRPDLRAPVTTQEIAALLTWAGMRRRRVKALGSGHSFSSIARPADIAVVLPNSTDGLVIDPVTSTVRAPAGITLAALNRALAANSLAMTNLGDIEQQTLAGALATGTHGTGSSFGGLATQVRGIEIVLGTGEIVDCSADVEPELFSAARIGLGALGVITSVTLQAEPLFALRAEEFSRPVGEVLSGLDEIFDEADHCEFYWFPHTTRALVKRNTRVAVDESQFQRSRCRRWVEDEVLANGVYGGIVAAGRRMPTLVPALNRMAAAAVRDRTYSDLSYRVFTSSRRVRFVEMEYAVPRDSLVEVLTAVMERIDRSGLRISFPLEIRTSAPDDIPLSTACGRATGYIAVHMEHHTDFRPYFACVEPTLAAAAGRPHWGKMHSLRAETLRDRYPGFDSFLSLRRRCDPMGVLGNDYLDRVLGRVAGGQTVLLA